VAGLYWPEIAGDYNRTCGGNLAATDQGTFLNAVYAYFVTAPNEFRSDVRDNFEEFLSGVTIPKSTSSGSEKPIFDEALGMLDQLESLESLVGTTTFGDVVEKKVEERAAAKSATPQYPTVEID